METVKASKSASRIMRRTSLATLLTILPAGALCDGLDNMYVAGDLGSVTYANMSQFPNPKSFRITVGKRFAPHFASEMSFIKFADSNSISPSSGGTEILAASALQIAALGSFPLDEKIDLFGKVGLSLNRASGSNSDGTSANKSKTAVSFGVGQQYHFTQQLALRFQYEDFGAFESASSPMKATVFSLGLVYER